MWTLRKKCLIIVGMKTKQLVTLLTEKEYTISFAESCTGGMLANEIVSINNSSKVIKESFVTYSEESKMNRLGVKESTLAKYSVYSNEVTDEMAKGIALETNSTIGIGVSGIAGPTGGDENNPVGTVYFSLYDKTNDKLFSYKKIFKIKCRNHIRRSATKWIIKETLNYLAK